MRIWPFILGAAVVTPIVALIAACKSKPEIDGASVPRIGSEANPPACPDVCDRLSYLCGYAPADCLEACADYDDGHRLCVGQVPSCLDALQSCENAPEQDGGDEGGPTGEAEIDSGAEDAAIDAADDD
jgi:hypothetical protein